MSPLESFELFLLLMFAHSLADYAFQTDWMANHKSPYRDSIMWAHIMRAHALIHGGMIFILTGIFWMALAEVILHFIIDYLKTIRKITIHRDQAMHTVCKIAYVVVAAIL